ncbi:transcriptional activator DEMETER-like [Malania oleifera]|uniref:transcriptional activator DEMETER-like n=1 Tax=Malania oleifera TaxID=397392 RepID=UPI0025ADCA86|nr:transcriptional activator DEMETER-like [Malania oleifera]
MEMRRGSSISNESSLKIQGSWVPGTPYKPILPKPQQIHAERQGNQLGWLKSERFSSGLSQESGANVRVVCYDSTNCGKSEKSIHNWEGALAGEIHVSTGNISFEDHLEFTGACTMTPMGASAANQLEPSSTSSLFEGQDMLKSNIWINNCMPNIPQYGLSIPSGHSYDLNSPPSESADAVFGGKVYPIAPITPDKSRNMENKQVFEVPNICIDEQTNERNMLDTEVATTRFEIHELHSSKEHPQLITDSSFAAVSTKLKENHNPDKESNCIDLNKTPQQKQRRRKHRPKVVAEKPKRTRSPRTPKQVTPKPAGYMENTTGKRKYVRRNVQNKHSTTPPAKENEGIDIPKTFDCTGKSCRRALNFDLDDQAPDENLCRSTFNPNADLQAQNFCRGSTPTKLTVRVSGGTEEMVETTHIGTACDLNRSVNSRLKDYLLLPGNQVASIPLPTKTSPQETLKVDAQNENSAAGIAQETVLDQQGNVVCEILEGDNQSAPRTPNASNCTTSSGLTEGKQTRGLKREYSETIDPPQLSSGNPMGAQHNCLGLYQPSSQTNDIIRFSSMHFPEICKKRRTEKVPNSTTSSSLSSVTEAKRFMRRAIACHQNDCRTNPSASEDKHSMSAPRLNTGGVQAFGCAQDKLPTFQFTVAQGQPDRLTKKRSRGHTRVRNLASLNRIVDFQQPSGFAAKWAPTNGCSGIEALVAETRAILAKKKRSKKRSSPVNSVSSGKNEQLQEINVVYGDNELFAKLNGSLVVEKSMPPFDAIVEQFKHLSINRESNKFAYKEQKALVPYYMGNQESNALVIYRRDGTVVPFEGTFDPVKKRRPRPKVDLDEETNRVWKLLMANIKSEGIDGTDEQKAKWWEEERRVFRGRADSFIARMHLVQGDRRFSQWKGSVVDSVIGVFLTQNVSDHLSSSAFMSLAAHFPLKSKSNHGSCYDGTGIVVEDPDICMVGLEDTIDWNQKMSNQPASDHSSVTLYNSEPNEEKEVVNSSESFGSSCSGVGSADDVKDKSLDSYDGTHETNHESIMHSSSIQITETRISCLQERDTRTIDDVILSQNSVVSSQNSLDSSLALTAERIGACSDGNSEVEELATGYKLSKFDGSNSFLELLQMAEATASQEVYSQPDSNMASGKDSGGANNQSECLEYDKQRQNVDILDGCENFIGVSPIISGSQILEVGCFENSSFDISKKYEKYVSELSGLTAESVSQATAQKDSTVSVQEAKTYSLKNTDSYNKVQVDRIEINESQTKLAGDAQNNIESSEHNNKLQQNLISPKFSIEALDGTESTSALHNQKNTENMAVESNSKEHNSSAGKAFNLMNFSPTKAKKGRSGKQPAIAFDWDSLRKEAQANGIKRERTKNTMDSLDWEAVRTADVKDIANTIKERGMNNMLAERIKDFLNRLVREHGSLDLEWLRDVPPDKAKEYLLSIRGLGLKSVECVRLLTLHHLAFPVDTNVGRIAVRLGWVPLQPLPESLQLHLLELYPVLESIQKYLWPRLCKLDQRTLYELHYQMITFGKVFCTKSKPNCNACPMRGECRHFASAFASARLALPGPEEKSIVSATKKRSEDKGPGGIINALLLSPPQANQQTETKSEISNCEPIIEVPATPEPVCTQKSESDMEDTFYEDHDEIPTIKLNIEEFTQNLQNYMQNNMELQEGEVSKALVALTPEVASIPMPKLKNVSRLRTEHQVYELPDSHPLLKGLDEREPDDPCSYLLAIWTPGETANSIQPPERSCDSHEFGKLCNEETCFSCNSIRESNSQTVRGTLLIPCRTAMRGSFPLNGTYFQVNEVFADHDSSLNPIGVPRSWLWNLPRRTVYFGTSIPTIFKGLSTEGIQHCFWRGYVCVRGFDQRTRAPRPLMARLHFPASKLNRRKGQINED